MQCCLFIYSMLRWCVCVMHMWFDPMPCLSPPDLMNTKKTDFPPNATSWSICNAAAALAIRSSQRYQHTHQSIGSVSDRNRAHDSTVFILIEPRKKIQTCAVVKKKSTKKVLSKKETLFFSPSFIYVLRIFFPLAFAFRCRAAVAAATAVCMAVNRAIFNSDEKNSTLLQDGVSQYHPFFS